MACDCAARRERVDRKVRCAVTVVSPGVGICAFRCWTGGSEKGRFSQLVQRKRTARDSRVCSARDRRGSSRQQRGLQTSTWPGRVRPAGRCPRRRTHSTQPKSTCSSGRYVPNSPPQGPVSTQSLHHGKSRASTERPRQSDRQVHSVCTTLHERPPQTSPPQHIKPPACATPALAHGTRLAG
jgi:hypothetical protein